MTFRYSILLIAGISFTVFAQEEGPCNQDGNLAQVQCLAKQTIQERAELEKLYRDRLKEMPEKDLTDHRRNREQLVRAQAAWERYVSEHCDFVGGQEGGSNLWVTHFAAQCELEEIRKRSEFFRHLGDQR